MTNPQMRVPDVEAVARVTTAHGLGCIMDTPLASPANFPAIEWGVALVLTITVIALSHILEYNRTLRH